MSVGGSPGVQLSGRSALVVGGGWREPEGSIGGAVCRELAARGAHVAVVDIDGEAAQATADFIASEAGKSLVIAGDAATPDGAASVIDQLGGGFQRIDILVNNIGASTPGGVSEVDVDGWDRVMALNVRSVMLMTRCALPRMKRGASIVNVSSIAAWRPGTTAAYCTSKAAIEGLTRSIAHNCGRSGVRANCVRPGEVLTWRTFAGMSDDQAERARATVHGRSVLGWPGDCWDIARAVAFLASDDARWITGEILTVDGGAALKRAEIWPSEA